jgi:hypothetical protein
MTNKELNERKNISAGKINDEQFVYEIAKTRCILNAIIMRAEGKDSDEIEAWVCEMEIKAKNQLWAVVDAEVPKIREILVDALTMSEPDEKLINECSRFLGHVDGVQPKNVC